MENLIYISTNFFIQSDLRNYNPKRRQNLANNDSHELVYELFILTLSRVPARKQSLTIIFYLTL